MADEQPTRHKIAVLEEKPPPQLPKPRLVDSIKGMVPIVAAIVLFGGVISMGLCVGLFTWWWPEPAPVAGGTMLVMPFVVQGEDPTAAGTFQDDLLAGLAREPRLQLLPRERGQALVADARPLDEIGRAEGARWVVQGEIRPSGENVVITYTLVDAEGGGAVFAQRRLVGARAEMADHDDHVLQDLLVGTHCAEAPVEEGGHP